MAAAKKFCSAGADYFACRLMPHGGPVLVPTVLATLGLCASLADDGCDYARLTGAAVQMLTGSDVVPFVDCGLSAYRIPGFYPGEDSWRVVYSEECRPYDSMNLLSDTSWVASEWLRFLGLVVGGTTVMFLWTSACLTLRPNHWQAAGIGAAITCLCQMCSFVWFYTKMCHTTTTNFGDFEVGREVEGDVQHAESKCSLFFGSKCAIVSCVMWFVASAWILLREYPIPVPKLIPYDESARMMTPPVSSIQTGGVAGANRRIAARSFNMGKSKKKTKEGGSSSRTNLTASMSTAGGQSQRSGLGQSQRSLPWVSGMPATGGPGEGNMRASLKTSMRTAEGYDNQSRKSARPAEFTGSTLSAVSFV